VMRPGVSIVLNIYITIVAAVLQQEYND